MKIDNNNLLIMTVVEVGTTNEDPKKENGRARSQNHELEGV